MRKKPINTRVQKFLIKMSHRIAEAGMNNQEFAKYAKVHYVNLSRHINLVSEPKPMTLKKYKDAFKSLGV